MIESGILECRWLMSERNSLICRRTPSLSLHTQPTVRKPCARAYSIVKSSLTNTSGRMSRIGPFRAVATGGSETIRPLKRIFRSNASAQSSAVWPSASTVHPCSAAIR